ncbi:MAG: hypothetical protein ABI702_04345 [Burkholderiales bacterium]
MNTTLSPNTDFATQTSATPGAPRFDMYATIHKALRSFMGETLVRIGRVDVSDPHDTSAALAQLDSLLTLCLSHIEHENLFVHTAIEARQPGGAARTGDDHAEHRDSIDALRAEAAALRAAAGAAHPALALRLYHHLALFVAENLQHMHIEESANNAALWAAYSDAELIEIHQRLLASVAPAEFMLVARWMVPALNPMERAQMLGGIQAQTPPEAFLGVLAGVHPHLDVSGWDKLARALRVAPDFIASGASA